jgi:mono/diheme cytochrome c family protein
MRKELFMTPGFPSTVSLACRHAARISFLATIVVVLLAGCEARPPAENTKAESTPAPAATAANIVERGRYLVTTTGCNDCHTPLIMTSEGPKPDMTRMLSGHPASMVMPPPPKLDPASPWGFTGASTLTAFAGPWGVSYAANLTPHPVTGLGAEVWTEELFMKAIRTGRHFGTSRPIMPPWMWMAQMTDDDLKAMWAYLRTIPPIDNLVPDYEPPAEGTMPPHGAPAEDQPAH